MFANLVLKGTAVEFCLRILVSVMYSIALTTSVIAQQRESGPAATASALSLQGQWVDLTHTFDNATIYWPTEDGFQLTVQEFGLTDKGYFYASKRFASAEHGGTHLDAPIHFSQQGKSVDQLSIERFVGEAAVVDVTDACSRDADYQVNVTDLRQWELQNKRQLVDVIVLIRTGFSQFWKDRQRYLGTSRLGPDAVTELHFPGLAPDAARWLADHRSVKAVGIDTASIDYGQSQRFQSHVTLFKRNIPVFENVANLHLLPEQGSTVIALPMKIGSGTGAPLRIVASVPTTSP